jgi:murein DD-endopeptidase MepM/ murein hydrolase activator NlpD
MNDFASPQSPGSCFSAAAAGSRLCATLAAALLFWPQFSARASPPQQPAAAVEAGAPESATLAASPVEGVSATLRPANAAPGELFEIDLRGAGLRSATAKLGGHSFPLFEVGEGHLRGYGAVPLEAGAGRRPVTITARLGKLTRTGEIAFNVDERAFVERTLTVARKFTSPSKQQKARMKADSQAFAAAYRVPSSPPLFSSNFMKPLDTELNSPFGVRRVFNGKVQTRHLGIDLDGEIGMPIYAANDGVVRMARDCFAAGNAVLLSHGAGLFTSYFHLSKFEVKVGQRVKKGQIIGLVGKTGRVTGPHLHLSSKLAKTTFDPEALFAFDFFPEAPVAEVAGSR